MPSAISWGRNWSKLLPSSPPTAVREKTAHLLLEQETLEEEDIETLRSQIIEPDAPAPQNVPEKPRLAPTHS